MDIRWILPIGIVAVIIISGCASNNTAYDSYREDVQQKLEVSQKIKECATWCAGEDKDIPAIYNEFYRACYDVYYYGGLEELESFEKGCLIE